MVLQIFCVLLNILHVFSFAYKPAFKMSFWTLPEPSFLSLSHPESHVWTRERIASPFSVLSWEGAHDGVFVTMESLEGWVYFCLETDCLSLVNCLIRMRWSMTKESGMHSALRRNHHSLCLCGSPRKAQADWLWQTLLDHAPSILWPAKTQSGLGVWDLWAPFSWSQVVAGCTCRCLYSHTFSCLCSIVFWSVDSQEVRCFSWIFF